MPRETFHQELARLDALILELGNLNERTLASALTALSTRDISWANDALAQEPVINELHLTIRTRVTTAIALQAQLQSTCAT